MKYLLKYIDSVFRFYQTVFLPPECDFAFIYLDRSSPTSGISIYMYDKETWYITLYLTSPRILLRLATTCEAGAGYEVTSSRQQTVPLYGI